MECSNKDILFQAAEAWMDLTQYRYIFTYGYKCQGRVEKATPEPGKKGQ